MAAQRKDEPSTLNLSHHALDHQGEGRGSAQNPTELVEKSQALVFYSQSHQEPVKHRPLPKAMLVANGNLVPTGTDPSLLPVGSEILVAPSLDLQARVASRYLLPPALPFHERRLHSGGYRGAEAGRGSPDPGFCVQCRSEWGG